MTTPRLAKITDGLWIDPAEVAAVQVGKYADESRIYLAGGQAVRVARPITDILDALGVDR